MHLISNRAKLYGGALYVDDKTNSKICVGINDVISIVTECFSKSVFLSFSDNSANISSTNLFGGFLDRCKESYQESELGLANFLYSSNINESQLDTVTSSPFQLCLCKDNQSDCNYIPEPIQFNGGKAFSLQLIAYNHISKPVRAAVDIHLSAGSILAGQFINNTCTEVIVQFNVFTPIDDFGSLTLSVIGPCNVAGISTKNIIVKFTACICPIGFQISTENEMSCDCVCDQVLQLYEKHNAIQQLNPS